MLVCFLSLLGQPESQRLLKGVPRPWVSDPQGDLGYGFADNSPQILLGLFMDPGGRE